MVVSLSLPSRFITRFITWWIYYSVFYLLSRNLMMENVNLDIERKDVLNISDLLLGLFIT